jgi:hypothetical protein
MDELIARIATAIGVEASVATAAVGHVLEFLRKEFPNGPVAELISKLPGSEEAINAATTSSAQAPASGLGGLMGAAGGVMGLAAKLNSLGLDMGQIQKLAKEVLGHAEQVVGRENVEKIVGAIPALKPFL